MTTDGTITITVPVTNTGKVAGEEVVQLYISDPKSSLPRPAKELKGFKKLSLKPGETANAVFTITADDLSFFDPAKHEWVAEKGKFVASVGAASDDIKSTVNFNLK